MTLVKICVERDAGFWCCKKKRASILVLKHYGKCMYNLYIYKIESLVASEYKVFTF